MRQATLADLDTVKTISADAYRTYEADLGFIPVPAVEDYGPRIERGEVWLLEAKSEAVGLAVLEDEPDYLFIYSIAVRLDQQGKGYGLALLRFADERARAIGAREIRLYTNQRMERNIAIYQQWGFVITGTRAHPSRPGHVLVDMAKGLR